MTNETALQEGPLLIRVYEAGALRTDQGVDGGSVEFPLLGLFGEVGSLLSEVKKKQRDQVAYIGYEVAVEEELGDVLWYLAVFASRMGTSLIEIAGRTIDPLRGDADPDFSKIQPALTAAYHTPTLQFEHTLLKLAGAVGDLVSGIESDVLRENQSALLAALTEVFRTLVRAADEASVSLETAARRNLKKTADRWPVTKSYPLPLDEDIDPAERLPRDLTVEIFERTINGRVFVYQRCNGVNIGDRLTDNVLKADDYRFHDAFHYAYAAILTWSPVTRALFRLKRKGVPVLDEGEDGARAILTEEGIAAWIFGFAKQLDFFSGIEPGGLPLDMLKSIRRFVGPYEVSQAPLWLWEEAILAGYGAFRFLKENRRARLRLDMETRKLQWEELPE